MGVVRSVSLRPFRCYC